MSKIPTAASFAKSYRQSVIGYPVLTIDEAIEYAKLNVKAALEAAAKKAKVGYASENPQDNTRIVIKESILNAYPENLIQ